MDLSISVVIQNLDFYSSLPLKIFLLGTFWSLISLFLSIKKSTLVFKKSLDFTILADLCLLKT